MTEAALHLNFRGSVPTTVVRLVRCRSTPAFLPTHGGYPIHQRLEHSPVKLSDESGPRIVNIRSVGMKVEGRLQECHGVNW